MPHAFTIGHSTHSTARFVELLHQHSATAVADVRSSPSSRFTPQFNRAALERSLASAGIHYVFLGNELGARSSDPDCYVDGVVQYDRLAQTAAFREGIDRLLDGMATQKIVIMCTENDPLACHRTVLVANELERRGATIDHIHRDGRIESHADALERLLREFGLDQPDLLHTHRELIDEALQLQEKRIAYVLPKRAAL
jgi:uncharacterized protein (DUF488 family)